MSNIAHFESGEAACSHQGVPNRLKGARLITVFDSGDNYADNCIETTLFSKVGIDWIRIVMLSGPPLVITEVIDKEWPGLLLCASTYLRI